MNNGAIILAAGKGFRFKALKQFVELKNKPLWKHVFDKVILQIPKENVVVVGVDIPGGETRSLSVRAGLEHLHPATERVIILEAARPLVTIEQINILLDNKHPSASFVMPLTNTVVMRNGCYINRDEMYELLTPQAFQYRMLKDAYQTGKFENLTDDTRVMFEMYNIKPFFIETSDNLMKITYQKDIKVAEALMDLYNKEKR